MSNIEFGVSDPRKFEHVTDTSYLSPGLFCLCLIKLYEVLYSKYDSFSEPRNDFIWCIRHWCNILKMLAHIGCNKSKSFYENALSKVEPSEISFLSDLRNHEPFVNLSLEDEIWLYKTLIRLF